MQNVIVLLNGRLLNICYTGVTSSRKGWDSVGCMIETRCFQFNSKKYNVNLMSGGQLSTFWQKTEVRRPVSVSLQALWLLLLVACSNLKFSTSKCGICVNRMPFLFVFFHRMLWKEWAFYQKRPHENPRLLTLEWRSGNFDRRELAKLLIKIPIDDFLLPSTIFICEA